ncbi:MAG: hypothetical protein HY815_33610 [Candidatus Riflebacteria bacterium]|nr:hypothetical protein [Candidatus Riflebacteria bacterium]
MGKHHRGFGRPHDVKQARSSSDRGRSALAKGDLELATRELSYAWRVLEEEPIRKSLVEASVRLGRAKLEARSLASAAAHLDRAWRLDPTVPGLTLLVASSHWLRGNLDQASAVLSHALERDARSIEIMLALTLVRAQQGNTAAALALLQRAIDILALPTASSESQKTAQSAAVDLVRLVVLGHGQEITPLLEAFGVNRLGEQARSALSSIAVRHEAAAQWLADEIRSVTEQALSRFRERLAEDSGASHIPVTPEAMAPVREALTDGLESALPELERRVEESCQELPALLKDTWQSLSVRAIGVLLFTPQPSPESHAALQDQIAQMSSMVPQPPRGLPLLLQIASWLACGKARKVSELLALEGAAALPASSVAVLMRAALTMVDGEPVDAATLAAFVKQWPALACELAEPIGDALFLGGDLEATLRSWKAVAQPTPRIQKGMALAFEALSRDAEAIPCWRSFVTSGLDQTAGADAPDWLPAAVIHLARLYSSADRDHDATALLRQAAARLPGSVHLHAHWVKHLIDEEDVRDLQRAAAALRRLAPTSPEHLLLVSEALIETEEYREAVRLLGGLLALPTPPPEAGRLFDEAVGEWVAAEEDDRRALSILEESSRFRAPTAWLLHVESAIRDCLGHDLGRSCRERALDKAGADPDAAIRIALDLLTDEELDDARRFLACISTLDKLDDPRRIEAIACARATGDGDRSQRWLEEELAHRSSDAARAELLALIAIMLGSRCMRPDLAVGLVERALLYRPRDESLSELLERLQAMANAIGISGRRRAGSSPGGLLGSILRWWPGSSQGIEEER